MLSLVDGKVILSKDNHEEAKTVLNKSFSDYVLPGVTGFDFNLADPGSCLARG